MIEKLTSRKFWTAITGIVTGIILMFSADENLIQLISGCILTIADTVIYIISEAEVDKEHKYDSLRNMD